VTSQKKSQTHCGIIISEVAQKIISTGLSGLDFTTRQAKDGKNIGQINFTNNYSRLQRCSNGKER